jgi:hypothetical protein
MLTFEKVLEIFKDYLALDTELEVCKSRYGYVRVEYDEISGIPDYCSGVVCRTPEELFNVLLDDVQGYEEIRLTKGQRDTTAEDLETLRVLRQRYLERREEEMT